MPFFIFLTKNVETVQNDHLGSKMLNQDDSDQKT